MFTLFDNFKRNPAQSETLTETPKKEKTNRLTIYMKDKNWISFETPHKENQELITPWLKFVKWYTSREQSNYFIQKVYNGYHSLSRDNISNFKITVEEKS